MNKLNDFVIRGSSAGLVRHGEYLGDSASNCPRKTILRHLDIQETHSKTTLEIFSIGHYYESYFQSIHPEFQYEVEVNTPGLKGHADAVCSEYVWELKSVTSKNTKNQVWKKNTPKSANVLQLAVYLLAMERQVGMLCYGDFTHIATYDKLVKMRPEEIAPLFKNAIPVTKTFRVEWDENGCLLVDGEPFHNIHVSELIEFQDNLHELVRQRILPPRIEALEPGAWSGPCKFCPLATLCDSGVSDLEEFIDTASEIFLLTDENR